MISCLRVQISKDELMGEMQSLAPKFPKVQSGVSWPHDGHHTHSCRDAAPETFNVQEQTEARC